MVVAVTVAVIVVAVVEREENKGRAKKGVVRDRERKGQSNRRPVITTAAAAACIVAACIVAACVVSLDKDIPVQNIQSVRIFKYKILSQ